MHLIFIVIAFAFSSMVFQNIMSRIENLKAYDPFADTTGEDDAGPGDQGLVHIRIQQRNGRKTLTTVQGLSSEYDFKKIVKVAKKEFACNGTVVEHPEYGEVVQLQVTFEPIVNSSFAIIYSCRETREKTFVVC